MPLTPSATRELLAKLGHNPKRFLGQNFLVDGNIVRKSLDLAQITPADTVIEIGPGLGTLTAALLETGAQVWAVEKDATLHAHLAATLAPKYPQTLHLLEGDALAHPLAGFSQTAKSADKNPNGVPSYSPGLPESARATLGNDEKKTTTPTGLPLAAQAAKPALECGTPVPLWNQMEKRQRTAALQDASACESAESFFKIVANLPYAISTPWMDAVLSISPLPERMVLMLQQEAAQRYTAAPGTKQYSAISIFLQNAYDIAPGHKVSAACFYPRPDIESYLLHLVRKPHPFIFAPETKNHIRACFQQRRKQLGALLRARLPSAARETWFARLAAANLTPQARPEEVPVAVWMYFPSGGFFERA